MHPMMMPAARDHAGPGRARTVGLPGNGKAGGRGCLCAMILQESGFNLSPDRLGHGGAGHARAQSRLAEIAAFQVNRRRSGPSRSLSIQV